MAQEQGQRWPKRIRLDRQLYRFPYQVISITISCRHRGRFFEDSGFTNACRDALRDTAIQRSVDVFIYCFMPDHVHFLVQPKTDVDIIEFVQRYKSWTTRLVWNYGIHGKIWQPRFYDHILRENDDPVRHMRYIAENPIRAGLVETLNEYPFLGSFVYDLETIDW